MLLPVFVSDFTVKINNLDASNPARSRLYFRVDPFKDIGRAEDYKIPGAKEITWGTKKIFGRFARWLY